MQIALFLLPSYVAPQFELRYFFIGQAAAVDLHAAWMGTLPCARLQRPPAPPHKPQAAQIAPAQVN
jgi:hypothetical protein